MTNNVSPQSRYLQVGPHRIHYLDQGRGDIILFVHGIPEWSMTYTAVIAALAPRFRCIVPDHLGFGLSDKDTSADLTPAAHAARLLAFIKALGLDQPIHLVMHDYGGPIGLMALKSAPEFFASLTISNTWCWDLAGTPAARNLGMLSGWLGRWLYLSYGFSVKFMARNGFADKRQFQEHRETFMRVHSSRDERYANYILMLEMLRSGPLFSATLSKLKDMQLPVQFVWGASDKFFTVAEHLARWQQELPHAPVHQMDNCGHFPHIEKPVEYGAALASFVAQHTGIEAL